MTSRDSSGQIAQMLRIGRAVFDGKSFFLTQRRRAAPIKRCLSSGRSPAPSSIEQTLMRRNNARRSTKIFMCAARVVIRNDPFVTDRGTRLPASQAPMRVAVRSSDRLMISYPNGGLNQRKGRLRGMRLFELTPNRVILPAGIRAQHRVDDTRQLARRGDARRRPAEARFLRDVVPG